MIIKDLTLLRKAQGKGYLPQCGHGHHLIDWSGEILEPPCGCRAAEAFRRRASIPEELKKFLEELDESTADHVWEYLDGHTEAINEMISTLCDAKGWTGNHPDPNWTSGDAEDVR